MPVGVGVIGTGTMGADHVRTLAQGVPGAEVVAVSDLDLERARKAARAAARARVYGEPGDLIRAPEVEAVLVASPDPTHEELVLECLAAAKPVLCEKPLAPAAEACLRIVEAEARFGRRLVQVGFMRRFDPGYVEMKRALDSGAVGGPLLLHCAHRLGESPPGFASETLFIDCAVHEIDVARWLLGQEIAAVTVHAPRPSAEAPEGLRDPTFVVLETDGGAVVDVEVFVNARYGYDIRCELVGELGCLALPPSSSLITRARGSVGRGVPTDWIARFPAAYASELRSWVAGCAAGEIGGPTAWDGYAAQLVVEACLESAAADTTTRVRVPSRPLHP